MPSSRSRIPSPARSQGAISTPRREKLRRTRSVCSPAQSDNSAKLTAVISNSFVSSPLPNRRSVLTDDTAVETPRRKSWWKKLDENCKDVMELLENKTVPECNNVEEYMDVEILSQEKKNITLDLPESSDGESIASIVIPQRKLFNRRENLPQKNYEQILDERENLPKLQKSNIHDKELDVRPKNLFSQKPHNKPAFPAALLNISTNKTFVSKTKEKVVEASGQVRNLFGNRPGTKRKNMFTDFILSESEDEIPEIQPRVFGFKKNEEQKRRDNMDSRRIQHSPTSSFTDIDIDDWKLLPSSTMLGNQIEEVTTTPNKRTRLSKFLETKESEATATNANTSKNKTKKLSNSMTKNKPDVQLNSPDSQIQVRESNSKLTSRILNETRKESSMIKNKSLKEKLKAFENIDENEKEANIVLGNIFDDHGDKSEILISDISNHIVNSRSSNELQRKDNLSKNKSLSEKSFKVIGNNSKNERDIISENIYDTNNKLINYSKIQALEKLENNTEPNVVSYSNQDKANDVSNAIEDEDFTLEYENDDDNLGCNIEEIAVVRKSSSRQEHNQILQDKIESRENYPNSEYRSHKNNESQILSIRNKVDENEKINQDYLDAGNVNEKRKCGTAAEPVVDETEKKEEMGSENNPDVDDTKGNKESETEVKQDLIVTEENDISEAEDEQEIDENEETEKSEVEVEQNIDDADDNVESEVESEPDVDVGDCVQSEAEGDDTDNCVQSEAEAEDTDKNDESDAEDDEEVNDTEENNKSQIAEESEVNQSNEENGEDDEMIEAESDYPTENNECRSVEEDVECESDVIKDNHKEADKENEVEDNDNSVIRTNNEQNNTENHETRASTSKLLANGTLVNYQNKDETRLKSPEAIMHNKTNIVESFRIDGRNTSVRKTKSVIKNPSFKPSLAPIRTSAEFSDGTRDSSAEGSGWDSHRTTRKTLRQTFGKDFTMRKSLRELVMEKSAKRQTDFNQDFLDDNPPPANSTEFPDDETFQDNDPVQVDETVEPEECNHDVSERTQQRTLEMYLDIIKKRNIEKQMKMEEEVTNSLKVQPRDPTNMFRIPLNPVRRSKPTKPIQKKQNVKAAIPLAMLPAEFIEDMKYKPPKRFQPNNASWITKRLYKFLETKLEPKYDYKARVRAEKLMEVIYKFTRDMRRHEIASADAVESLKQEMACLGVVQTHFDFYEFFNEFMPREIRIKVIPDLVNKISLPRHGIFSDILR